jgi:Sulfotransferase domain
VISWRKLIGGEGAATVPPVDFLIAGVQKGGTFSLYRLLERHPEISLSKSKEVHFFDDEASVDWAAPRYEQYHSHFPRRRQGQVWGEATPVYIYWPDALERIRAYNPDIKLIVLLRDPIERAYSAWCHQQRKERETLPFAAAIREGRARITAAKDFGDRHFSYVERGFYAAQLRHARDLFPAANILLLDSRNLSRDPASLVAQVTRFLDLSAPDDKIEPVHANKRAELKRSGAITADDVTLLADVFARDVAELEKGVDFSLEHWPVSRLLRGEVSAGDVAARLAKPGFAGDDKRGAVSA